jgi:hypothetical protein
MDIQGTLDPFVPGSWKLWGSTEVYTCDTDAQNGLDTYTRELTYDTLFPWHKDGYEFWQLETTEGIEWTRTVYWVGIGGDPPYLGAHSLTTTGIEYYSADGPGAPSTEEPPIEEPSSEDAVFLDDVSEEDFDLDQSDFQAAV